MKYLIVDLNIELNGHKYEIVNELMKWIDINGVSMDEYHFLLNLGNDKFYKPKTASIFVVEPCSPMAIDWANQVPLKKYQMQWAYIMKASKALKVERLILMEFDLYKSEMGQSRSERFEIHAIWFEPYLRQVCLDPGNTARLKFALSHFRKRRLFNWAMRNSSLKKVFLLNDHYAAAALSRLKNFKDRVAYLPDPVLNLAEAESFSSLKEYGIESKQFVILIFGEINERRNIPHSLDALSRLPEFYQQEITLLIVGQIAQDYEQELRALMRTERKFNLITKYELVSSVEKEALFAQCDIVLDIHVNYFANSSTVGMCAKYGKPMIVANYGLLAEIVKKYQIGTSVDPLSLEEISMAIATHKENKTKLEDASYVQDHHFDDFASVLLGL